MAPHISSPKRPPLKIGDYMKDILRSRIDTELDLGRPGSYAEAVYGGVFPVKSSRTVGDVVDMSYGIGLDVEPDIAEKAYRYYTGQGAAEWYEKSLKRQDAKGGHADLGGGEPVAETAPEETPQGPGARGETEEQVYGRHIAAVEAAVPFIKAHEGFRSRAYMDSTGKWTIGYGQTEIGGRAVRRGDTIDEATASEFVKRRVHRNASDIYRTMEWTRNASTGALAALYDLAYNGGVGIVSPRMSPTLNRMGSEARTREAVDEAIWSQVPTYVNAGGRKLRGLVNRRSDAIREFRGGIDLR